METDHLDEAIEDLLDSLELLEARAKDNGVRYSSSELRAKLGLPPLLPA